MNLIAHPFLSVLLTLLAVWLVLNALSPFLVNQAMFHPQPASYPKDHAGVRLIRDAGGNISAYWMKARKPNGKTILISHGNGEDFGNWFDRFAMFNRLGFNVLSYDYPGYGYSEGKPTETGVYRAADAAYRYLTDTLRVKPSDLILYGYSIGTGPSCYLTERYPVAGLIFHSGFYSAPQVVTRRRILWIDPFPNGKRLRTIACPKLFLHGREDRIVPFAQGCRAYEAAAEPKTPIWVEDANHYTIEEHMGFGKYEEAIRRFALGLALEQEENAR